jgi:LPXTG-motif cell wall-anchored protein
LAADITRAAELPFTGSSTVLHLLAAALLIAAGAGCVIIGRRRAA